MILYSIFIFLLIASAQIANKIIVTSVTPFLFVGLRMGISGILLLLFCSKGLGIIKSLKKHFSSLVTISLFTTFVPSLLRAYAFKNLPASRASFWGTLEPFVAAIYMRILFGKKLTNMQVAGCCIGIFSGAFFAVMNNSSVLNLKTLFYLTLPDLAAILVVIVSRYGWIRAQVIMQEDDFKSHHLNGLTFTITGILATAVSIMSGECYKSHFPITIPFWGSCFYTLIIGNMIAYTLYGRLIKNKSATFVSLAGLSIPLFVHLLAPFVFGDKISWTFFVSAALIFVALQLFHHGTPKEKDIILPQADQIKESVNCKK